MDLTEAMEKIEKIEKINFNPLEQVVTSYDASKDDLEMLSTLEMTPRLDILKLDSQWVKIHEDLKVLIKELTDSKLARFMDEDDTEELLDFDGMKNLQERAQRCLNSSCCTVYSTLKSYFEIMLSKLEKEINVVSNIKKPSVDLQKRITEQYVDVFMNQMVLQANYLESERDDVESFQKKLSKIFAKKPKNLPLDLSLLEYESQ